MAYEGSEPALAMVGSEYRAGMGVPAAGGAHGAYKPEKFPVAEEHEAAQQRFAGPVRGSPTRLPLVWLVGKGAD